jgi:phthalate 4,5-dioxygenase
MLSQAENDLLARTGPGTPMGKVMRRYWIPALFSHQLPEPDCSPKRVRLMSEHLVAFRQTDGRVGLVAENCAHRGASLYFGRNEECGLRCVYHGWKFNLDGQCVDMPNEPPESNFKDKIHLTAYPCEERGGIVWTYMGPPALKPGLPEFEWLVVPEAQRFMTRRLQQCNWLQAMEGGIDSVHVPFLHRGSTGTSRAEGLPHYELLPTEYGFMVAHRHDRDGASHWSAKHWIAPFFKTIARFNDDVPIGGHAWVPVDDHSCLAYSFEWHPDRPFTDEELATCRSWSWIHAENIPGSDRTVLNAENDYLIDRELQRSGKSFTGIWGIGMQDTMVQESMGPILDRTQEHLGTSDSAIIAVRRYLLQAVKDLEKGTAPRALNPASHRVRSARFESPIGTTLKDAAGDHVKASSPAYALLNS